MVDPQGSTEALVRVLPFRPACPFPLRLSAEPRSKGVGTHASVDAPEVYLSSWCNPVQYDRLFSERARGPHRGCRLTPRSSQDFGNYSHRRRRSCPAHLAPSRPADQLNSAKWACSGPLLRSNRLNESLPCFPLRENSKFL